MECAMVEGDVFMMASTSKTTLNRAGEEHWELASVVINTTSIVYPVFKQPKLYAKDEHGNHDQPS